ncbi:N-alpha-acetyltransferase 35, NatC auxiliary subunit [Sarcoptes scabiei]|uniref:Protein MAK10 homolog n=1 Tax=Sarcoptes scabiei TaxID=52283 RepID=A0A834REM4_SARSC|nr:N-alpha-acetyltransferase 35, NatC auxiliary subunit [Sarcoptes scabiei]UXI15971.1 serine-threonine kinase receptor-associated protein [Sarcoptes scabiei]
MGSVEKSLLADWTEITKEFRHAAEKLDLGELIHDEHFGLFDAMAAIELMDPKMDAGMICNKNRQTLGFEEMIEKNLIKIDAFPPEELIGIIDETYCCLITWLNGHSLAQTVFINIYLHNPNLICDKTLKTFCIVILKIVAMLNNYIILAFVCEEEDFQTKNYGFDLFECLNYSKILPMVKVIENEINQMIDRRRNCDSNSCVCEEKFKECDFYKALLIRIKFTKYFFLCLYSFKKYLNVQNSLPFEELILQLNENLDYCDGLLDDWIATIDFGIQPKENLYGKNSEENQSELPTIIGFKPLINQRLLAPSFPRYTQIKSRSESLEYLKNFLKRLRKLLKLSESEKFIDVLRFFNTFSADQSSCVLSRSLLQLFYLPKSDLVYGKMDFVKVIKDSCKELIKPPSLSGKVNLDIGTKELVSTFFNRCLSFFKNLIQIYGHNRASQRGKLIIVLNELVCISEECSKLEQCINNPSYCDYLQIWILFYKFNLISQYLLSGFELELYSIHEYAYIYFELDYIWDYLAMIFKRASEIYDEHEIFLNTNTNSQQNTTKNRKKYQKQSKIRNHQKYSMHEQMICYFKGMNQMSSAMHRLMMAMMIENKIQLLKHSLNTEQIRYNHRFYPLAQFDGTLQSYPKYRERYDLYAKLENTQQLYLESCQLFEQARNHFEILKESSYYDEVQSYIKVAKTNSIVSKLLMLSDHKNQGRMDFHFTETPYYPIIRFAK